MYQHRTALIWNFARFVLRPLKYLRSSVGGRSWQHGARPSVRRAVLSEGWARIGSRHPRKTSRMPQICVEVWTRLIKAGKGGNHPRAPSPVGQDTAGAAVPSRALRLASRLRRLQAWRCCSALAAASSFLTTASNAVSKCASQTSLTRCRRRESSASTWNWRPPHGTSSRCCQ
jgi:hypothetical protein